MRIREILAVGAGLALLAAGSPAHAAAADDVVNTKATGVFTTDSGQIGKPVTFEVTVSNTSTVIAHDITAIHWIGNHIAWAHPDPKDVHSADPASFPKFDLAPGESRTISATGTVTPDAFQAGSVFALAYVRSTETESPNDNITSAYVPVAGAKSGILLTAKGTPWQSTSVVPVPGVRVELSRTINRVKVPFTEKVTGADGTISLKDIPVGTYNLTFTAPSGWKVTDHPDTIDPREGRIGTGVVTLVATGPAPTPTGPTTPPTAAPGPAGGTPATTPAAGETGDGGDGGGLPITGANGALFGGVGLGLLLLGGLAFFVTRRRRTSFISAD